jgi:hypothetical protein
MKHFVAAILLSLGGCASSGPPALFDLDSSALLGQVAAQRAADAAAGLPVPYSPTAQPQPQGQQKAVSIDSSLHVATQLAPPQPHKAPDAPTQVVAYKSNVVDQATPIPAGPIAPIVTKASPIQVAAVSAVTGIKAKPVDRILVAPLALPAVQAAPIAKLVVAVPSPPLVGGQVVGVIQRATTPQVAAIKSGSPQLARVATEPIKSTASTAAVVTPAVAYRAPAGATRSDDHSLHSMLFAWSAKEKWTVVWAPGVEDIQIPPGQQMEGSLAFAVQTVSKLIPPDSKLQITMYEGDRVIHVHAR